MAKGGTKTGSGTVKRRYADLNSGPLGDAHNAHGERVILDNPGTGVAVRAYSGTSYAKVNRGLRQGEPPDEVAQRLDTLFADKNARFQQDSRVYRGIGFNDPIRRALEEGTLRAGATLTDKGFVSTSVNPEVAQFFATFVGDRSAILRIRARKGKRGVHIEKFSKHKSERETLLPRGSRFKVRGVTEGKAGAVPALFVDVDLM